MWQPYQVLPLAGFQPLGHPRSSVRRLEACKRPQAACPAGRGAACLQAGPLDIGRGTMYGQRHQSCEVSPKDVSFWLCWAWDTALVWLAGATCRAREPHSRGWALKAMLERQALHAGVFYCSAERHITQRQVS